MTAIIITGIICLTLIIIAAIGMIPQSTTKEGKTIDELDNWCQENFRLIADDWSKLHIRLQEVERKVKDVH